MHVQAIEKLVNDEIRQYKPVVLLLREEEKDFGFGDLSAMSDFVYSAIVACNATVSVISTILQSGKYEEHEKPILENAKLEIINYRDNYPETYKFTENVDLIDVLVAAVWTMTERTKYSVTSIFEKDNKQFTVLDILHKIVFFLYGGEEKRIVYSTALSDTITQYLDEMLEHKDDEEFEGIYSCEDNEMSDLYSWALSKASIDLRDKNVSYIFY